MRGKGFLFTGLLLIATFSFAQQKVPFEVIHGDSVLLYFNKDFSFTDKPCFDFIRRTQVNNKGDFNGYFEDRNAEGILLGKGTYINGIKHGYFEFYYPSGIIYCLGFYKNNLPTGIWEYFYESGIPERTIQITDSITLLLKCHDYTGRIKVQDGNGKFEGIVEGEMPAYVIGKVVNGRPDGKWYIPGYNGSSIFTEKFENGKLIKSSLVSKRKMRNNKIEPTLNKFFVGNYLSVLEKFKFQNCDESEQYHVNSSSIDVQLFNYYLRRKINNVIRTNIQFRQYEYFSIGDNYMTVKFSVNEKGKAYDYQLVTDWGGHFFESVKNSINRAVFSSKNKTMYFHLKFLYTNKLQYKYSFKFSKRNRKTARQQQPRK
jgi:hypothetical protein